MWSRVTTEQKVVRTTSASYSLHHDLIGRYWAGGPGELTSAPLNRICTLARKMRGRFVAIEDAFARASVVEHIERLENALGTSGEVEAVTLSFLWTHPERTDGGRVSENALLAQATVVTFPDREAQRSFVLDGLVRRPCRRVRGRLRPLTNHHFPITQAFETEVFGRPHRLIGAYYREGDRILENQAAAATAVAVRSLAPGPLERRPPTLDATPRVALRAAGHEVISYLLGRDVRAGTRQKVSDEAWATVASLIESGSPVILECASGEERHTLAVLGYTLNSDEWHPAVAATLQKGRTSSSSAWIDHLIVHHPRFGPYLSLSRGWLSDSGSAPGAMVPLEIVAPLPPGVSVSPTVAETVASYAFDRWLDLLDRHQLGRGRWWRYLAENRQLAVLRTTLTSRDDYHFHLMSMAGGRRAEEMRDALEEYRDALPPYFWMSELSLPQLYGGIRAKLGEVIVGADHYDDDEKSPGNVLAFRLPSLFGWRLDAEQFGISQSGPEGHVPLLASGADEDVW